MIKWIIPFLIWCMPVMANTNIIDLLTDMEAGNPGDLVTSNLLFNCSHTNGNIGYWLVSTNSILTFTNLNEMTQRGPVIVNGTPYTGSGNTKTIACDNHPNLNRQYGRFRFATTHAKISVGFGYLFNSSSPATFNLLDAFALENGGAFCNISVNDKTIPEFGFETGPTPGIDCTSGTNYVQVVSGRKYWITFLWDGNNASARMQVYDTTTWAIVSNSGCSINGGTPINCESIYFGRYDNHPFGVGNVMYYDNIMVDLSGNTWPLLPIGAIIPAASSSWTDISNACLITIPGGDNAISDIVSVSASSNQWSGELNVTNTCMIRGAGTNSNQTVIQLVPVGDSQKTSFRLSAPFTKLRDMQIRGEPGKGATNGWGIHVVSNNCSISNLYMQEFLAPVVSDSPYGVVYNSFFRNSSRLPGRCFGSGNGQANWDAFTPFNGTTDWAKPNFFVFEDCKCQIDSGIQSGVGTQAGITSQQGALWVIRRCSFNIDTFNYAPVFDSHGETDVGLRGNIAIQVYSNYFKFTSAQVNKFVDIRGGAALVYSNNVDGSPTGSGSPSDQGVYMRYKDGESVPFNDRVTNVIFFANYTNGPTAMAFNVEVNDQSDIIAGRDYTNAQPATIYEIPYPHPLRNESTSPGPPPATDPAGSRLINTRVRVRR